MSKHDIVVIGASTGGFQAVTAILEALPRDLPAAVFVVLHSRSESGVIPQVLGRAAALPVEFARNGNTPRRGIVYVAPPDHQLTLTTRGMLVTRGPRENGFRPAIDPLFRSAARAYGPRVIGVILSGALDDGTYGLGAVKRHGGTTIVQDPDDAAMPSMPLSALNQVEADYVVPAAQMASIIGELAQQPAEGGQAMGARKKRKQPRPGKGNKRKQPLPGTMTEVDAMEDVLGPPSALTCPDCGGALWEVEDEGTLRYKCHVGHQFSPDSLFEAQRDTVEGALWSAVRVLEEHSELRKRMAQRATATGMSGIAERFEEGARNSHRQAEAIRAILVNGARGLDTPEMAVRSPARSKRIMRGAKKEQPRARRRKKR